MFKKQPTSSNHLKLTQAESLLQAKMSIAKSNYESELVRAFANKESSKIYNYIKSLSRHDTLPPTMYLNSTPALSDSEKASLFNHYFHSVFTSSPFVLPPLSSLPTPNSTLNNVDITIEDVYEALCYLDLSKASGPDGIGQKILKFRSIAICGPLLYLFTQCLAQHTIPSEWRIHSITPIHKSGDRANISNYRPISLLSCTSKLLERIIYNKSIDFITNTVVSNHQFGFLKHRSSVQQLLLLINTIYNSLLTHSPTDVIYLDFRKAFDTVSHPKLLFKLWSSGITGDLWMWFRAYLLDRQQYVTINGQQSNLLPVLSGIPQGPWSTPIHHLHQ